MKKNSKKQMSNRKVLNRWYWILKKKISLSIYIKSSTVLSHLPACCEAGWRQAYPQPQRTTNAFKDGLELQLPPRNIAVTKEENLTAVCDSAIRSSSGLNWTRRKRHISFLHRTFVKGPVSALILGLDVQRGATKGEPSDEGNCVACFLRMAPALAKGP